MNCCISFLESAVVSSTRQYAKIRENTPFLTTRFIEANFLEKIGNFLLTPAHFLLNGKTVSYIQEEDRIDERQTFDYSCCFMLKTVVAILTLPIALIIGGIFKGFAYISCEVRERIKKFAECKERIVIDKEIYDKLGVGFTSEKIEVLGVKKPAWEQVLKKDPELANHQKAQVEALRDITAELKKHRIAHWIDCGTALGAYRHRGMIPWDSDVDLSILKIDHQNAKNALKQGLDPKKYEVLDLSSFTEIDSYMRVYIKEVNSYVDLYHYQINESEETVSYLFPYEDSWIPEKYKVRERAVAKPVAYDVIFPLKTAEFDGLTVYAPNKIIPFLKSKYGENLDPARVWNPETKEYEKVPNHPYWKQSHF